MSRIGLAVPNIFAAEGTGPVPVSQLDSNNTAIVGWIGDSSNGFGYWLTDTGAGNSFIVTFPVGIVPSGLTPGFWFVMRATHTNTGGCTVTVNGLSAQSITDSSGNALTNATIVSGNNYAMMYTGTTFSLLFPTATASLVGEVKMFAGSLFPTNYLACNGALVSTVTYATLFSVIGGAFGTGSGTFRVPNYVGSFPTHGTPGAAGGSNANVISVANLPAHNHPASSISTSTSSSTDTGHSHTASQQVRWDSYTGVSVLGGGYQLLSTLNTGATQYWTGNTNSGNANIITGTTTSTTTSIGNTGSGTPFATTPAYVSVQFIIRAF